MKQILINYRILLSIILIFTSLGGCSLFSQKRNTLIKRQSAIKKKKKYFIKKNAAILPIYNSSRVGGDFLATYTTESLRLSLIKSGNFIFLPELKGQLLTSKQVLSSGGSYWPEILKKAKDHQLNTIIFGEIKDAFVRKKVDEIGFVKEVYLLSGVRVEIRVIDVEAEVEIGKKEFESYVEDKSFEIMSVDAKTLLTRRNLLLNRAVDLVLPKINRFVSSNQHAKDWTGRIARIDGENIYINAGKRNGIKIGDILRVVMEGKKIYDPQSGAYLGKSKGMTKATIEIVEFFGANGSIAQIHSGGTPAVGDKVKLY